MGQLVTTVTKCPLLVATMLNLFMPRTKHFKQPVVHKLYALNIILLCKT